MPPQSKTHEVGRENLIPTTRGLAKRLRQSILKARDLRRAATQAESRLKAHKARRPGVVDVKGKPLKGDQLRVKARKANIAACKLLGHLLDVKSRIEISLLRPGEQFGPLREALEKLTFATDAPASNRWPAAVSVDEENVLAALDEFERLLDAASMSAGEEPGQIELSGPLKKGQFCDRVIDEIRKIRHLYPASTVAQIKTDHPRFLVWEIVDHPDMDAEDRDIFFHPRRWGPVVGYAIKLLARHFGKSEETIRRWRKGYRRHTRPALPRE